MKIERVESLLVGSNQYVRIFTDNGLSGIGQSACWGYPESVDAGGVRLVLGDALGAEPLQSP